MKKITYKGQSKILIALCNLVNELVDAVGSAGNGDMKKSVYDTDGNGIVDNAEKVNGHTVGVNVPTDAKFTDSNTTYTMSLDGSKLTLTDSDGNKQKVNLGNASVINNHEERLTLTEYMNIHNDYFAPLMDDDGHVLLDDNDNAIMVDWKYQYA